MSILSAQSIRKLCIGTNAPMINPFYERTVRNGLTFGLDSAGYDIRAAESRLMWPFRFTRLDAIEEFNIPDNLKPAVCDKSTWARLGIVVQNTRAEPGWHGVLRLEVTNHAWWFRYIRKGTPIAQVEFHMLDEPTEQPYRGRYQGQGRHQNAIYAVEDKFLGYMFSRDRGIWTDSMPDRLHARKLFGLTEEQSQHPNLCFEELSQEGRLWEIVVSAIVYPKRILRCYLSQTP